jgi:fermentation-respiration switch protein FrsA (DUF1100 family)
MSWLRRLVVGSAVGLAMAYAAIILGAYITQRSMIFPAPQHFPEMPEGYQQVSFTTADGLALEAAWRLPEPGRAIILFLHGNGDNWSGAAAANRVLAQAGYGILLAEYRGYGGNPGAPSEEGLYADARAAMAWLGTRGFAPDRVVVVGNSMGSGPATQLALESTPAALVLISGYVSLPAVVAEKLPWLPADRLVKDRFDNLIKLGRIKSPVLLLHGTADTMISAAHSGRLAAVAPSADLVLVAGSDHGLAYDKAAQSTVHDWLVRKVFAQPTQRQIPAGT